MKGIISGIKRMEIHDGDGIRTTVFFKGCPLKCKWCHNPESISYKTEVAFFKSKCISCGSCKGEKSISASVSCPTGALVCYGSEYEADALARQLLKDKPFFETSGGGVTFSGGECLTQIDFAVELARILKSNGVSVYIDTCGFVPRSSIDAILPYADKFLYDIKAISPEVHKNCTGRDNATILENLRYLVKNGARIEIRYPLVKGENDGQAELIGEFLADLGGIESVKVLRYHSLAASRYEALGMENSLPPQITEASDVENAKAIISSYGIKVIS